MYNCTHSKLKPTRPRSPLSRPGGYAISGDECYRFTHAVCREEEASGNLTIEAEGDNCLFRLPDAVWQVRTGWVQDAIGLPWPYDVPWREPEADRLDRIGFVPVPDAEPLADCALWVPGQLLEVVRVQVEFEDANPQRSLPTGTGLRLGGAVVEVTGARTPCRQLDGLQKGLMAATRVRVGRVVCFGAAVMAVVVGGGEVAPGDAIEVELPPEPHRPVQPL